jgi:general stress protein YciG
MAERKQSSSSGSSHRGGSGNFAEDREKASEAGRKGGEYSGGSRSASAGSGRSEHRGGSGNFAENRARASEAGRKGGQSRGGR